MKRIVSILTTVLALFTVLSLLVGCNNDADKNKENGGEEEIVYVDYTVTVVDGLNNPVGNVIVNFAKDGSETKMRVTDKDGKASYKNAVAGDYTVTLEQGLSDVVIEQNEYKLTKDITSLKAVVRDMSNTISIYGDVPENAFAYTVVDGVYNVVCESGKTFLVFNAPIEGIYNVSFTSDDTNMTIGHYGIPMFVQSSHCGDLDYDGKSFQLVIKDKTTPYVIGIFATKDTVATLSIERIGDAPFDPSYDAEWVEVQASAVLEKCNLNGKTLVDFDIASKDITVSLGDDGYYYTNSGKLVYVRISTPTGHGYVDENQQFVPILGGSLALLSGHVDSNVGINIGGYVYDSEGNFVEKLRYNDMIKTYSDYTDPTYGVVPLTVELAECIMLHGESNGWWNQNGGSYLFTNVEVNPENAWLFLCMIEE